MTATEVDLTWAAFDAARPKGAPKAAPAQPPGPGQPGYQVPLTPAQAAQVKMVQKAAGLPQTGKLDQGTLAYVAANYRTGSSGGGGGGSGSGSSSSKAAAAKKAADAAKKKAAAAKVTAAKQAQAKLVASAKTANSAKTSADSKVNSAQNTLDSAKLSATNAQIRSDAAQTAANAPGATAAQKASAQIAANNAAAAAAKVTAAQTALTRAQAAATAAAAAAAKASAAAKKGGVKAPVKAPVKPKASATVKGKPVAVKAKLVPGARTTNMANEDKGWDHNQTGLNARNRTPAESAAVQAAHGKAPDRGRARKIAFAKAVATKARRVNTTDHANEQRYRHGWIPLTEGVADHWSANASGGLKSQLSPDLQIEAPSMRYPGEWDDKEPVHARDLGGSFNTKNRRKTTFGAVKKMGPVEFKKFIHTGETASMSNTDLAGKWKHGWIPENPEAVAEKDHRKTGGARTVSKGHGSKPSDLTTKAIHARLASHDPQEVDLRKELIARGAAKNHGRYSNLTTKQVTNRLDSNDPDKETLKNELAARGKKYSPASAATKYSLSNTDLAFGGKKAAPFVAGGGRSSTHPNDAKGRARKVAYAKAMAEKTRRSKTTTADNAITPGGRAGDASPLGRKGSKRQLSDYEREVVHALIRKGHPKALAIPMARGIIKHAAATGRWGKGKAKPNVVAGAVASIAQRKSFSNDGTYSLVDMAEGGAKWKHGFIPENAEAVAEKEHKSKGKGPESGKTSLADRQTMHASTGERTSTHNKFIKDKSKVKTQKELRAHANDHAAAAVRARSAESKTKHAKEAQDSLNEIQRRKDVAAQKKITDEQGNTKQLPEISSTDRKPVTRTSNKTGSKRDENPAKDDPRDLSAHGLIAAQKIAAAKGDTERAHDIARELDERKAKVAALKAHADRAKDLINTKWKGKTISDPNARNAFFAAIVKAAPMMAPIIDRIRSSKAALAAIRDADKFRKLVDAVHDEAARIVVDKVGGAVVTGAILAIFPTLAHVFIGG